MCAASFSVSESGVQMRSFQQRLATFTDNTANLVIQLWELNELRERLRQAQQSARRLRQSKRRKRAPFGGVETESRLRRS